MKITISGIKLNAFSIKDEIQDLRVNISKKFKIKTDEFTFEHIVKKSIDARKKPDVKYIYSVCISVNMSLYKRLILDKDVTDTKIVNYEFPYKAEKELSKRPVIVGLGPAGLFCGYFLAVNGFKPVIIERGYEAVKRSEMVNDYFENGVLDEECNVQFGEGGAGTFSDGKLMTGVKDKYGRISEVLKTFVKFGANDEILYLNKPHIGTDYLIDIVTNMRKEIVKLGGEVQFGTKLSDIILEENKNSICDKKISKIIITDKNGKNDEIITDNLVLAIGHSARDTFRMLHNKGIYMENKPFAVGYRVSHLQSTINFSQYGSNDSCLPASDYKLTYTLPDGKSIYSFCMCPGGYIVNSSSIKGNLTVNGMSYSGRDSQNANSAIVMTVDESDYGNYLFAGMDFQERIEKNAYNIGNGKIIFQKYCDFKKNQPSTSCGKVKPLCKGQYDFGNQRNILDNNFEEDFIKGIEHFGNIIKEFNDDDMLICGVESRTSSPVKIIRDDNFECNIKGVYPCGEGAGYAGGITSAAVDGIKMAEQIAKTLYLR